MDLFEIDETVRLRREEAADRLRAIADEIAGKNSLDLTRGGHKVTLTIPDQVDFNLEVEVEDGENSIEIEISW